MLRFSPLLLALCFIPSALVAQEEINLPAHPLVEGGWNTFAEAAVLCWWAAADGLAYATDNGSKGRAFDPQVEPGVGFKVGVGGYLPHDGWDLTLRVTELHNRSRIHRTGEELTPLWTLSESSDEGFVQSVNGHWRLHLGLVDLELGRRFLIREALTLRPFLGLRYAIIRQKYILHYEGGTLFPGGEDYISMKNKFMAPGLLVGLDTEWMIKGGWSLYSDLGFSVQSGRVYVHESERVSFEKFKRANIYSRFKMDKAIFDFALGFQWETGLFHHRYHLLFQAGWEQHIFFAQNQLFHFSSSGEEPFASAQGELAVQGLVFSSTFSF